MIKQIAASIAMAICLASGLCGQEQSADEYNFMTTRLSHLNALARLPQSDLELSEEQKSALLKLRTRHQAMIRKAMEIEDEETKFKFVSQQTMAINEEAMQKILLPHQIEVLDSSLFGRMLKSSQGNLANLLSTYFRSEFGFTDSQLEQIKKLNSDANQKIKEATEEYKKQIEEIKRGSELKLKKILSPNQLKQFNRLQGSHARNSKQPVSQDR